jgi:hypothetical protein
MEQAEDCGVLDIVTRRSVNIEGFGLMIGISGLFDTARLHFTVHYYTYKLVTTLTSSLPLLGNAFQRRTFPFLWVPKLSLSSATSS